MLERPAPIESVAIDVSTTDSSQADLVLASGLPNACDTFGHYSLTRDGDTFQVGIVSLIPDSPTLACAERYGMITTRILLEGGIGACKSYGVVVNVVSHSAQAIAPDVPSAGPTAGSDPGIDAEPRPDNLVELFGGEKTLAGDTGLVLTLIEVSEDSRCASDVVCIWAGRATVVLGAESDGDDLGELSLSIEGPVGSASETIKGYTIELLQFDPYPMITWSGF